LTPARIGLTIWLASGSKPVDPKKDDLAIVKIAGRIQRMQLAELSLPDLPINEVGFEIDPQARFAAARREHPWLARSPVGYVVTDYFAARELLGMDEQLRTAGEGVVALMKAEGSRWGRWEQEFIMAQNGAAHARLRDVLAPMFTPRAANRHRGLMRQVVSELLDDWAPRGRIDFEEFASYFPVSVMCAIIGASPGALPRLRSSLETLGLSYNLIPDFLPQLEAAHGVMEDFAIGLVAARRAGERLHAEPDLLDALVAAQASGELSEQEVLDMLIFLFAAGYDTSKNVLTFLMHHLMTRPEIYARCAEDLGYCAKVVEEGLRYTNPGTIPRLANSDFVYRDICFPKDTMLFFPVSVLGRDPAATPHPDRFDPERAQENRHLAFGRGMHICLGQFIARAQLEEGLHLIARRMRDPRLAGEIGWRPFPGVWGIRGLPIEFTPTAG
jgi:cytochrome P450